MHDKQILFSKFHPKLYMHIYTVQYALPLHVCNNIEKGTKDTNWYCFFESIDDIRKLFTGKLVYKMMMFIPQCPSYPASALVPCNRVQSEKGKKKEKKMKPQDEEEDQFSLPPTHRKFIEKELYFISMVCSDIMCVCYASFTYVPRPNTYRGIEINCSSHWGMTVEIVISIAYASPYVTNRPSLSQYSSVPHDTHT